MTTQTCTLPAEDLIAHADGYLNGGRRELVEAHLAACPHCQERMVAFREVDRRLRESSPPVDDPAGRAMIRTRLEQEGGRGRAPQWVFVAPVLLLLLTIGLVVRPVTEAGFPLGRFITFDHIEPSRSREETTLVEHVAPSAPDVSPLPFRSVEPATLPFDLVLAERSTPAEDRLQVLYRNGDDLAILVLQAPARPGMVTIDAPSTETLLVQDTTVLFVMDPRPDAVADLHWERNGVFFDVMVIVAPTGAYGGLRMEDALGIVEALIAAQDAAPE